jgi:hypothetical protein
MDTVLAARGLVGVDTRPCIHRRMEISQMSDLVQRLRDQQPTLKNAATEYNPLWDEAADCIDELESRITELELALIEFLSGLPTRNLSKAAQMARDCFANTSTGNADG